LKLMKEALTVLMILSQKFQLSSSISHKTYFQLQRQFKTV
jgi:hypothetical protein